MKTILFCIACLAAGIAYAQGSAAERKFIYNGMSEADVIQRIGKPSHKGSGQKSGRHKGQKAGKVWTYFPAADDPQTTTVITLANGQVVNVERKVTY